MIESIKKAVSRFKSLAGQKPITVISHFDTDGITSAAIFSRALQREDIPFTLKITKSLNEDFINELPNDHFLIFLDLASNSLQQLEKKNTKIIILDHHEISQSIPEKITLVNPHLTNDENCSSAAICYLFSKILNEQNKDLASLAVIGMVGDQMEKHLTQTYNEILKDAETQIKKGLLLYPATRPLDKTLEYSSSLFIPDVTGSFQGAISLLREAGIEKTSKGFPSLIELTEEQMSNLITAILLKRKDHAPKENPDIVGNIYLVKVFNKLEDAREISAQINACSRMGSHELALGFCLGNKNSKKEAEKVYTKYRQNISAALRYLEQTEKIQGKNYTIINAKDKIQDTIIGTIASIMSFSPLYPKGTIIVAMAYDQDKIKVSARLSGKKGRNVREILTKATVPLNGEVGGHPNAAGCLIPKEKESQFIQELQKLLEIELVKV